jgi:predicted ATP-dependent endonuclease of OLD family
MRLLTVRIRDFRCVQDSTEFPIADVTCLVGKNESGKTALLKAVHKLKPDADSKEKFEPSRDYPKLKWLPDAPIPVHPPAIHTAWHMDDADVAAVEKAFGAGVIANRKFTIEKGYDNVRRFGVQTNDEAVMKHLLAELKITEDEVSAGGSKDLKSIQKALKELKELSASQQKLSETFEKRFPEGINLAVIHALAERVPTFL